MPMSPSREPSPHRSRSPTNSPHQHRQKEEEDPHLHIDKNTKTAKLEQLRSARLTCRDQAVQLLDMQGFKW
jgi:hypothetical protein